MSIMNSIHRFSLFIFISYYLCFISIKMTGLTYEIYFLSSFFGYPSYVISMIITSIFISGYNIKYDESGIYTVAIGILLLTYSGIEFRFGVILIPIAIFSINIIYAISLLCGGVFSILYTNYK